MDKLARLSTNLGEALERRALLKGLAMSGLAAFAAVSFPLNVAAGTSTGRSSGGRLADPANPNHCCPLYYCAPYSGCVQNCQSCSPGCPYYKTCTLYKCTDTCGSGDHYYICNCEYACTNYSTC